MADALYAGVLESARDLLGEMSSGERSAWVSSALGLWREPGVADDPEADDLAFVDWLGSRRCDTADLLLAVLGSFHLGAASERAGELVTPMATPMAGRSWVIAGRDADIVVCEFVHDNSDLEVFLIDIDMNGTMVGVSFVSGLDDVVALAGAEAEVSTIDLDDGAGRVVSALRRRAADPGVPTDGELANMALLRARLAPFDHRIPDPRWQADIPMPAQDPEADAAALETLSSALRSELDRAAPTDLDGLIEAATEVVRWTPDVGRPVQELEALASLEWADWLGAVVGSVRAGVGSSVSGEALVDHVNRTPEVTTTIPKNDRAWFVYAFAVAVETWRELGLVDADSRLTEQGCQVLPRALVRAWSCPVVDDPNTR